MTSFAFILGVLPLYFASGAGKLGRHSVGTAIVGGMLFSTVLNLFFIPVLYVIVKTLLTSFRKKKGPGASHEDMREVIDLDGQATGRELKVS
jgi:HAE1 family hydrophobic/amphiphilic exporter-1